MSYELNIHLSSLGAATPIPSWKKRDTEFVDMNEDPELRIHVHSKVTIEENF